MQPKSSINTAHQGWSVRAVNHRNFAGERLLLMAIALSAILRHGRIIAMGFSKLSPHFMAIAEPTGISTTLGASLGNAPSIGRWCL